MSDEFANKSDLEIQALIGRAEHELQRRKLVSKEKLKEEIEEKLRKLVLSLATCSLRPEVRDVKPGPLPKPGKLDP